MTLRDYFAAKAMHGILSDSSIAIEYKIDGDIVATSAYQFADAMLEARDAT
jgi:hypothetical protein